MAKPPATKAEIEKTRERIIKESISLINESGFTGFSMRRLGTRLGVAAKTIYNYFADKDELYLNVLSKGFFALKQRMVAAQKDHLLPQDQLRAMAHAYVAYGLENPNYYTVLFSMDLPRFVDYVGTRHEALADAQNQAALGVAALTREVLLQVRDPGALPEEVDYRLMQLWSVLHGIISLKNSRVTMEVGRFETGIRRMVDDAVAQVEAPGAVDAICDRFKRPS